MSDNWIALIPEDPHFVPDAAKRERARKRFIEIAPDAEEIEIKLTERIEFYDCGQNLERIVCPSCHAEISFDWWQDRMDEDSDSDGSEDQADDESGDGFKLDTYPMPCCAKNHTLHELVYEWPQGFGRFALDAMNPNIGALDERYKMEFEAILGTKLRVIHQHI